MIKYSAHQWSILAVPGRAWNGCMLVKPNLAARLHNQVIFERARRGGIGEVEAEEKNNQTFMLSLCCWLLVSKVAVL